MSAKSAEATVEPRECPVVHGFDPMGDEFQAAPGMSLAWARAEQPVFYDPDIDYYVVTRYSDIRSVFVDTKSFSPGIATEPIAPICPAAQDKLKEHNFRKVLTLGVTEEPLHMQLRKRLDDPFSNEAIAEWEPMVLEVMTSYIDRFVKQGRADLIDELIHEAPAVVALAFLGVPGEDIEQTKTFAQGILKFVFGYPTEQEQVQVCDHMGEHQHFSDRLVKEMIEDTPERGFLPHAVRVFLEEPEGSPFNEDFLSGLAMNGLAAAHETTSNSAANAFHLLLTNRDSWERVCEDPSLIPGAVEECLRMGLSQCTWRRLCVKDKVVGGVKIPAGGRVLLVLASGNFDEEMFPEPEKFDIERSNALRQLAFGIGAHRCLGAGLAKLQMKVMIEELGRRLPHMRLVEGQKIEYLRTAARGGPLHLLVEWDPSQNPVPQDRP